MKALLITAALTLSVPLGAGVASAQDQASCRTVRPGLVQCTETRVYGRQPRTFYLLSRTRDTYELPELRRHDSVRDVRRSVRRAPF